MKNLVYAYCCFLLLSSCNNNNGDAGYDHPDSLNATPGTTDQPAEHTPNDSTARPQGPESNTMNPAGGADRSMDTMSRGNGTMRKSSSSRSADSGRRM